jgi:flagellar capping protein FliD
MKKSCFVIGPIGARGSKERKHSDTLLKFILKPVLEENFGYDLSRADQLPKAGVITTQIVNSIIDCDLVVADLTGGNPNVFYELAIRHATNKPYIQMINEGEKLPFDIQGIRTIEFDLSDLERVEEVKDILLRQAEEILKGHSVDSPITIAGANTLLGGNENALGVFLEKFWSIEDDVLELKENMESLLKTTEETYSIADDIKDKVDSIESEISSIQSDISDIESKIK